MRVKSKGFLFISTILVYVFLLAPLVIIAAASFSEVEYLTFPPKGLSLRWYSNAFHMEIFRTTLSLSLKLATAATALAMILGVPAAYLISRYRFRGRRAIENLVLSPVAIPGVVMGFSLLNFLMIKRGFSVEISLLIGHILIVIPYTVRVVSSSLANFDYSIEEAAISLGAGRLKAFFLTVLPNIRSGVVAAFIMSFINSFNNVPVSLFLTGPGVTTFPIQLLSYVEYYFDPTVASISLLLMGMTILIMVAVERSMGLTYFTKK